MNHRRGIEITQMLSKVEFVRYSMTSQEETFFTDLAATGIKVARLIHRLLYGTWESVVLMLRETFKQKPCKNKSINEEHRGGVASMSDEALVMRVEQRSNIV